MSEQRKKRPNSSLRGRGGSSEKLYQSRGGSSSSRSKMNSSQGKGPFQRQTSYDRVRKIVQEEGRTARNLLTWSVPIIQEQELSSDKRKLPKSPKEQRTSPTRKPQRQRSQSTPGKSRYSLPMQDMTPPAKSALIAASVGSGGRPCSQSSAGKKGDLRARYWAFLFENLRRAVDEIYQTCETDESEVECKEVIMMLEQCTKDFKSLIERMQLLAAFEQAEEGHKPTSLAWEVRKSSPGKSLTSSGTAKDFAPSPTVVRSLNFGTPPPVQRQVTGNSWADKVKGTSSSLSPVTSCLQPVVVCGTSLTAPVTVGAPPQSSPYVPLDIGSARGSSHRATPPVPNTDGSCRDQNTEPDEDSEGWETVQRPGRSRTRPSSAGSSRANGKASSSSGATQYQRSVSISETANTPSPPQQCLPPENLPHQQAPPKNLQHQQPLRNHQPPHQLADSTAKDAPAGQLNVEQKAVIDLPPRQRAGSHDSEKENQPLLESLDSSIVACSEAPVVVKAGVIPTSNRGWEKMPERDKLHLDLQPVNLDRSLDSVGTDPFSEDEDDVDDLVLEQDVDQLATELEHVLATALDEEDDLTSQLEQEQEDALESAIKEEETYLKEIAREQNTEVDVETETESELGASTGLLEVSKHTLDWDTMVQEYDERAECGSTVSWGDMVEDPDTRTPGRVVHMHEKLSSPSRKRSPTESKKRHEEKQAKAQELREKLLQDKAERLRTLTNKVEEVIAWKDELLSQKRGTMEKKLHRAEEKRQLQLAMKVRKAHEEETKANEIAFINTLEAQNKRHDIIAKHQESEARLQDMQEERQRKHEEKAAKEAAVEERRKAIEADRQARLLEMQQRRRQREEGFEQRQQEREKERLETARVRERDREERIAALNAQQQAHIEELQKKIQQKQVESDRRHKEQLGQIQEKAFRMSILTHSTEDHHEAPKIMPYEIQKHCQVCNVLIPSEVYLSSHLRGKKHLQSIRESNLGQDLSRKDIEDFNLKHIFDAPSDKPDPKAVSDKERQKALKKRCKKLRQRMAQRGSEYESSLSGKQQSMDSDHKAKLQKIVKDVNKYLQTQDSGPWPQNKVSALDRAIGEIGRIMDKKNGADQWALRVSGGLTSLSRILLVIGQSKPDLPPVIPMKSLVSTCTVFRLACKGNYDNSHYMLFSNKSSTLVDLLMHQLNMLIPDNFNVMLSSGGCGAGDFHMPYDALTSGLMQLIAAILSCLAKNNPGYNASEASAERMSTSGDAFMSRANDIVSYVISVGVLDKLSQFFSNVRGPIDADPLVAEFLQHSMGLLIATSRIISRRSCNLFTCKKQEDPTQLIHTLQVTNLVGIVSLMYGMLLHSGAPSRSDTQPPELPPHTLSVATVGFRMLNHLAILDLPLLQDSLGEEGTSLELRHIASYLLWYCHHWPNDELLHELILCVGYFTTLNHDNQVTIQSGQPPTVLQQLCSLPFQYFSDPKLTNVLFPTLVACCYQIQSNREILEQELSCALLANFIEEKSLEMQTKQSPTISKKSKATGEKDPESRMGLGSRFPMDQWQAAQDYFSALDSQ